MYMTVHIASELLAASADPEGGGAGGGPDPPPPRWFVRGGVLWRGLMGRRVRPTVVFTLLFSVFFWLASLAIIIQTYNMYMYTYFQLQLGVQYGTVILSLYFPYQNYEKNPTSHPLLLWKGTHFSCLELHDFTPFKPKNFWRRTPRPPSPTHYNVICVFVYIGVCNCTKKHPPTKNKPTCK